MSKENKGIKITVGKYEVRMYLTEKRVAKKGILANISICIEDIVVKGFKLIETKKGMFLANPSVKSGDNYYDQAYFLDSDLREQIEKEVIKEYESEVE